MTTLPVISGNLRPFNLAFSQKEGSAGWTRELDEERAIGFDLLWLSHLKPALDLPPDQDPLPMVLDCCQAHGMQAILGIGSRPYWYREPDLEKERAFIERNIRVMGERYGTHPAFYAWYVPHEIYVFSEPYRPFIRELYTAAVAACKKAADKPVTVSPFFILDRDKIFGDFPYYSPAEYADYWGPLLKTSGFDIVMLQDSGEHFSYVTNAQREPFFMAMKGACDFAGAHLWGNVECAEFECPSIVEYARRYGRIHHSQVKNAPWRPVPIKRLADKLHLAARYTERIVTWGYYQYGRPSLNPAAAKWYADYKAYYTGIMKKAAGGNS